MRILSRNKPILSIMANRYYQMAVSHIRNYMKTKSKTRWTAFCRWTNLRCFGEAQILKVSYFGLALVPLLAHYYTKLGIEKFPFHLKLLFYSSLLISIGNLLYSMFCPKMLKLFDTPNHMYMKNLEIYVLRKKAELSDEFGGDYSHCIKGFSKHDFSVPCARIICFLCLVVGAVFVIWLALERSMWVYDAN